MITLKQLREVADLSQKEVCYATNVSPTRLSLFENQQGDLSAEEQEQVRKRIIALSADRVKHVRESSRIVQLRESASRAADRSDVAGAYKTGDRRLALAMKTIESRPSAKKLFASVKESRGYGDEQAAIFVLGRNYPK
jgi:hypothetical protein